MEQIVVDQKLIMLDGTPLSLITLSGISEWESAGITYTCRYDEITDEGDHKGKYRCLYEKEGSHEIFLLVTPPSDPEGFRVILFDHPPRTLH
ncbi:hypothetical protein ACJ5NV_15060 [Loktanella agnita]|uniref:hypothetical protein n=1 Tax=Loktanella agnita TaxID=287097 RepID=UPI00398850C1